MAEAPKVQKRSPVIDSNRFRLAEFERQVWIANIEYGVTLDDIQVPGFWAMMASQLRPYDHIEARAEDGSWIAYLIVTGSDRTWARVVVDRVIKLTSADVSQTQAARHEVAWKGPQHKYAVIRTADSEMVRAGFGSKEDANTWLREHERITTVP